MKCDFSRIKTTPRRFGKQEHFTAKTILLAAAVLLSSLLGGCSWQLAQPDGTTVNEQDRLIGYFITREHLDLFDMEAWLNDNAAQIVGANGGMVEIDDREKYTDRLYADFIEGENGELTVQFTGHEGWYYLENPDNVSSGEELQDDGPTWAAPQDVHSTGVHFIVNDEGEKRIYNAVFYVAMDTEPALQPTEEPETIVMEDGSTITRLPDDWKDTAFYPNPVYLTPDGEIYAVTGSGYNMSGTRSEGENFAFTISESHTEQFGDEVTSEEVEFKLQFYCVWPNTGYRFFQLDADGNLLQTDAFSPAELPEALQLDENTDCLLVERSYTDRDDKEHIARLAFDRSEQFLDGSRKEGDLIWTSNNGESIVLNLPVLAEDGATFDYHQLVLKQSD